MLDSGYLSDYVECDICTWRWVAVYPAECDTLEFPNCENMAGFDIVED